jgi:hypothetical protein
MNRAVPVYMSLLIGINHVAVLDGASSRVKKMAALEIFLGYMFKVDVESHYCQERD